MAWGDILAITYYSPSDACWFNPADGSKPCIPRKYEPADGENQFAPKSAYASLQPTELTYWWDFGGVPLTAATMPQYSAFHEAMAAGEGVLAKGSGDFTTRDPLEAPCLCGAEGGACRWFVPKALQPSSSAAGDGRLFVERGETGAFLQFLPGWAAAFGEQFASLGPTEQSDELERPRYSEGLPLQAVHNGPRAVRPTLRMPRSEEGRDGGCSIVTHDMWGGRGATVDEAHGDGWPCRSQMPGAACMWVLRSSAQWEHLTPPAYAPPRPVQAALVEKVLRRLRPHYAASLPGSRAPFIGAQVLMEGRCATTRGADCELPPCCVPADPRGELDPRPQVDAILAEWRHHPDHPANARAAAEEARAAALAADGSTG